MRHVETKELPAAGTDSVEIESGDRHDVHPRDGGVHPLRRGDPKRGRIAHRGAATAVEHQSRRTVVEDERALPAVQQRRRGQQIPEPANRNIELPGSRSCERPALVAQRPDPDRKQLQPFQAALPVEEKGRLLPAQPPRIGEGADQLQSLLCPFLPDRLDPLHPLAQLRHEQFHHRPGPVALLSREDEPGSQERFDLPDRPGSDGLRHEAHDPLARGSVLSLRRRTHAPQQRHGQQRSFHHNTKLFFRHPGHPGQRGARETAFCFRKYN